MTKTNYMVPAEIMLQIGKVKRIAICISGELRSWKQSMNTWKHITNIPGVEVDFFFHTWNSKNPPTSFYNEKMKEGKPIEELIEMYNEKISVEEFDELIRLIKPKGYLIEPSREFEPKNDQQTIFKSSHISQYYGVMMAGRLKKKYELENDFIYDVVVRTRFDLQYYHDIITNPDKIKKDIIYGFHHNFEVKHSKWLGRVADMFWYSDSVTHDILSDYFFDLPNLTLDKMERFLDPEYSWFNYIKKNQITIQPNVDWVIKIIRESEEHRINKNSEHEI